MKEGTIHSCSYLPGLHSELLCLCQGKKNSPAASECEASWNQVPGGKEHPLDMGCQGRARGWKA